MRRAQAQERVHLCVHGTRKLDQVLDGRVADCIQKLSFRDPLAEQATLHETLHDLCQNFFLGAVIATITIVDETALVPFSVTLIIEPATKLGHVIGAGGDKLAGSIDDRRADLPRQA
jgi:hypothetical protein